MLSKCYAAALQHRGAVVDGMSRGRPRAGHRAANDGDVQRPGIRGQALQMLLGAIKEAFLLEQIARRITGEREFREHHHVRARFSRPPREFQYAFGVAAQIANRAVGLCEGDLHGEPLF